MKRNEENTLNNLLKSLVRASNMTDTQILYNMKFVCS